MDVYLSGAVVTTGGREKTLGGREGRGEDRNSRDWWRQGKTTSKHPGALE